MAKFPTDIVTEILSWLPVEPLLCFRCVSKPWCALIDSPHFIKLHLKRSTETRTNRQLILQPNLPPLNDRKYFSVSMDSLDVAVEFNPPPFKGRTKFLGSCNGLILLLRKKGNVAIWNPSTRIYQILPIADVETSCKKFVEDCYGIGYDSAHDDYKVVKITKFYGKDRVPSYSRFKVYSLKMNSWRTSITDFPYYIQCLGRPQSHEANGALHWAAYETGGDNRHFNVVAFDLTTEDYRLLPMPSFYDKDNFRNNIELSALEGCLCICSISCVYENEHCDVWVMKDYGVKESWTKLLTVQLRVSETLIYDEPLVPVAFSTDGTKVLLLRDSRKLVWYDLKHKVVQQVHIPGLRYWKSDRSGFSFCVKSLVSLPMGNEMKRLKQKSKDKKLKEIEKKRYDFLLEDSSCWFRMFDEE